MPASPSAAVAYTRMGNSRKCDGESEVITGHSAASVWSGRVAYVLQICKGSASDCSKGIYTRLQQ